MTRARLALAAALSLVCAAEAAAQSGRQQRDPHADEWRRYEQEQERRYRQEDRAFEDRQRWREERERREQWDELRRDNYRNNPVAPPSTVIIVPPPAPVYRQLQPQSQPCQVVRPAYDPQGHYLGDVCVR